MCGVADHRINSSAAIATDKHETRFLLRIEGDSQYKSYMRQDLWDRPYRKPRAMEPAEISTQLTTVMQAAHGKPPSVKSLRPAIKKLKTKLAKALGRGRFVNIVIGVPLYLSIQSRNEIHTEMHNAGFHVLSTIRQPALASTLFSYYRTVMPEDLFTTLVVDYNRASLDLSVTPTAHGASDILAQQSYPNFGEDALDVKIASLMFNDTIEGREWAPLGNVAQQIRFYRHRAFDDKKDGREVRLHKSRQVFLEEIRQNQLRLADMDMSAFANPSRFDLAKLVQTSEIERQHYLAILTVIDDFVNQHSYNADYTMSSAWNPRLSEKSNMLLSGDADESGFQALRRVLGDSDVDWPLASEQESPIPGQVSARGAAIHAKTRVMPVEREKKKRMYAEKWLQDEEKRQAPKFMVPHDL